MKDKTEEVIGLEVVETEGKELSKALKSSFIKLKYRNEPVIISFPRTLATCRYLKIPSTSCKEIENIISLQAFRYLPYPADELITGYQIISTDKEGFAYINFIITHKRIIEDYIKLLKEIKVKKINIILSSYGISNLYNYINPQELRTLMIIDVDCEQVELAIVSGASLVFSRSFKLSDRESWDVLFINEIKKTQDTYFKEISKESPVKVVLTGAGELIPRYAQILKEGVRVDVQILDYGAKVKFKENIVDSILHSDKSFVSLIGLSIGNKFDSLNLLPSYIKEQERKVYQHKEFVRLLLFVLGIAITLGLAVNKNLDSKAKYLRKLNKQLSEISQQAQPLEEIENRINLIERQPESGSLSLDILHEIHKIIPANVSLTGLTYEKEKGVVLRGQSRERSSIYDFTSDLKQSEIFKDFNIEIRFATQRRTSGGEIVNFEIVCLKD